MSEGMSPTPDPQRPQGAGHYRADDDIELPPIEGSKPLGGGSDDWSTGSHPANKPTGIASLLGTAALIAAVLAGGWFYLGGASEKQHPNWQYVAAAAQASTTGSQQLIKVDASGGSTASSTLAVSSADLNQAAMQQIRTALLQDDLNAANAALQSAQVMPTQTAIPELRLPTIDAKTAKDIKAGRKELYQIELFDCCSEDGDIVEVLVNGNSYAVVPIWHQGTMVSIPLSSGSNTITVRGVKDGGGGVTVSFRTSQGDFYARYMSVGEEHHMDVVVQ